MPKPQKMPSGNWRVRVYDYTDNDGKKHYRSFTAPTKKEAAFLAAEYQTNKKDTAVTYDDLTLAEAYERYIDSKSAVLSPSTIRNYRFYMKNDFPMLMKYKLSKLTKEIIQTAVNEISNQFSPKTVKNKYGLLSAVLKTYKPDMVLHITLPKLIRKNTDYIIPTTEEVQKLLENADERVRVPIILASQGSLRMSEVCALTLDDVTDLGIYVNKAKVENDSHEYVIKTTKSKAGTRFVPLSPSSLSEVRKWKYFDGTPKQLQYWFDSLTAQTGIKTTFHKLRHYFASECHANGIPDKYICKIGGWEDVAILQQIYQHTLRDKQEIFNDKVVTLFSNNFGKYDSKYDPNLKRCDK